MARAASAHAAAAIGRAILSHGRARIIVATGASQFGFLEDLTDNQAVDWTRVTLFHLDEYVGLSIEHPASFRRYILDRVIRKTPLEHYVLLDGEGDVREVCRRAGGQLGAGRRGLRRDRGERTPRLQRSARGLHDRGTLHHRPVG
jgi:glucosamine-6-phosphate deaminase